MRVARPQFVVKLRIAVALHSPKHAQESAKNAPAAHGFEGESHARRSELRYYELCGPRSR